jgi:cupin 2 domain-containing protein
LTGRRSPSEFRRRTRRCAVDQARPALERIVSPGQASPPGFWYDQPEGEWVLVLAGAARLRFQDETEARVLGPGDCIDIAPHRRHRVEGTDPTVATVWLAVFYRPAGVSHHRPSRTID